VQADPGADAGLSRFAGRPSEAPIERHRASIAGLAFERGGSGGPHRLGEQCGSDRPPLPGRIDIEMVDEAGWFENRDEPDHLPARFGDEDALPIRFYPERRIVDDARRVWVAGMPGPVENCGAGAGIRGRWGSDRQSGH
jgi:hypothetical protein